MSRKANHGYDYDDDIYEDYDEDYAYDYEDDDDDNVHVEHSDEVVVNKEANKSGVWCCSVCTYDNEESMTYCEICGVLRFPPSEGSSSSGGIDNKTVGGTCKGSGVSQLAKSLFASVSCRTPKMAVVSHPQNFCNLTGEGSRCHDIKNVQQHCHVFSDGQSASRRSRLTTIAPFKFDIPSPDDIISLNTVKKGSAGAPPGFLANNTATMTQSSARQFDSYIEIERTKSEDHSFASTSKSSSNNGMAEGPSSSIRSEKSPARDPKSKHNSVGGSISPANGAEPENLASAINHMSIDSKPGSSKLVIPKKNLAQYKPEKWMLPDNVDGVMAQLNLAIVGHVDSGKSTLSGRLLHLLGQISQRQMHRFEKESKQQGKGSFAYAWALDESAEERERGITMTVGVAYFDTKKYHVVVLDSPGHKDFVPNMISGATQADAAILVIDASVGAFETGMDNTGGQSREHAQLIRSFGVDQIIVAVNKMDVVGYSKERFELIKHQVGSFLRQCGFKESFISWVPVSAMENQNMVVAASDLRLNSWYKGSHLLDAINSLCPPKRDYEKPLLMPICDIVKTHSMAQISACGKLEAGALRNGCKVLVMPVGEIATVRSIECNSQLCAVARAGENVSVVLQGIDAAHVIAGGVLCHPDYPVRVASHLELKILIFDIKIPILIGSQLEFHIHHAKEAARVVKIVSLLDPKTGKETKKAPRCLVAKQTAIIEVALQDSICVEDFTSCKALGRVFLRSSGRTIAVGVVTQVIDDQK
ncbi:HBS1-like protein isoform X1 [Chenopodium quinoa]|uniref:HBS1-like protein isoform X1 n=1 Tax=Chenopodium quinoa TaxID=63459 RepID=UPI000B779534|nr:HBS1-like protein isoform X1 [Chenopodium quinoa]